MLHTLSLRLIYLFTNQLLNKVAGVYGLIAVLTGAGGSFAQLSMYIYSVLALVGLGWGLKAVKAVGRSVEHLKHYFMTFLLGGSKANIVLCPPLLCGSHTLHIMDGVFCRYLVGIYAT